MINRSCNRYIAMLIISIFAVFLVMLGKTDVSNNDNAGSVLSKSPSKP